MTAEKIDDIFVARYAGSYTGFYVARTLPLFIVFAILAILYLDDEFRRTIFSRYTVSFKPFSWYEFSFLLALTTAPLLDLALTLRRVRRDAVALIISADGIVGAVRHMTRLVTWSEIVDIDFDGRFLKVRRQPQSLLDKLFASRGLGDILVPARHIDRDAKDILAAFHRFAPAERPG